MIRLRDLPIIILLAIIILAAAEITHLRQELDNETLFSEYMRMTLAYEQRRIPEFCAEDVFLQGIGDYESGQYEAYECGPAMDDFLPAR